MAPAGTKMTPTRSYLDLWIELMRNEGLVDMLHDHWMLGRTAIPKTARWSVIRDVLRLLRRLEPR